MITLLISQIQLERKKEELTQQSLKNGVIPTSYEVGSRASEFFDSRVPGLPYYRPMKQAAYGISDKTAYNQMFLNLKEDLENAYQANIQNSHQNAELEENYLIEKDKIQSRLKALRLRLKVLDDAIHQTSSVYNYSKTFDHFYDIEFEGDVERNLPKTDCFIDLSQKAVYLDQMNSKIERCDLSQSTISVRAVGEIVNISTLGEPTNLLKDSVNESCTYVVRSKKNQPLTLTLEVTLSEPLACNSVQLRLFSQCSIEGQLTLHKENRTEESLYTLSHHNHFDWLFDSEKITKLTLDMTKNEADGIDEQGTYEYIFTFKNLAILRDCFASQGTFVSMPIKLDHAVGSIELQADELVFDETDINYFIGIDNGSNRISWEPITPGIATELNIMEDIVHHIPPVRTLSEQEDVSAMDCIFHLPSDCLANTLQITPAINAWHMTSFDYSEYSDGYPTRDPMNLGTINIDELQGLPGLHIHQDYHPASSRFIETYSNIVTLLTQYVEMETEEYFHGGAFCVDCEEEDVTHEFQLRAFVNGVEIKPIQNRLSFKLRKGRNKVQLMYVLDEVGKEYSHIRLQIPIDMTSVAQRVCGAEPLKQTDYQTLVNQMRRDQTTAMAYYTIVDDKVYVPMGLKEIIDYEEPISLYRIQYQRVKTDYKTLLTHENGQYQMTVRFMAVLNSQNKNYSPKLISYRLMAK